MGKVRILDNPNPLATKALTKSTAQTIAAFFHLICKYDGECIIDIIRRIRDEFPNKEDRECFELAFNETCNLLDPTDKCIL